MTADSTMKLEVKAIWIDNPSVTFENYSPPLIDFFGVWVGFKVGVEGVEGSDDFRVLVCSPNWLTTEMSSDGAASGRHTLLMKNFGFDLIVKNINLLVRNLPDSNWAIAAQNLSRFAEWEFEDYQE